MYLHFYGFTEKPFNTTPDPKFLCLTRGHREALAQLIYSVRENRGFLVLTAEVGTGKTTLLRALLRRLDASTATAFIFNPTLPFDGLLEYLLADLGLPTAGESRAQRLFVLNQFLIERNRMGQRTVLIIDEAQNLDVAALEQVRLLSNFETSEDKLLQILLVGQPELEAKLQLPELRQLRQRIELHCTIPPLSEEETREYIRTRLRIGGAKDLALFTKEAIRRVAAYAGGIPRRINVLCDHCLVIGYADQRRRIEPDIVEQGIRSLEGPKWRARDTSQRLLPVRRLRWVISAFVAALVAGIAIVPLRFEPAPLLTLVRAARDLFLR